LYALLLAIPLSGWLYSSALGVPTVYLGLWQLPDLVGKDKTLAEALKLAHKSLNFALLALVVVHVAAASASLVDRDGCWRGCGRGARTAPARRAAAGSQVGDSASEVAGVGWLVVFVTTSPCLGRTSPPA
jgi:hypothetical protein